MAAGCVSLHLPVLSQPGSHPPSPVLPWGERRAGLGAGQTSSRPRSPRHLLAEERYPVREERLREPKVTRVAAESKSTPLESQDEATPLHAVARKGQYATACRILSRGTEAIDGQDTKGRSPLFWATKYRQEGLVELLLSHGADPTVQDKAGDLCLHWAAFVGCAPIVRMLLEAGSDPNVPNAQGDSPLHVAARERHYECLLLLLACGADVCLKNKVGQTPLLCTRPGSPARSALQAALALPCSPVERVLSRDISRGFEPVPIPCLNGVDGESCPSDFLYVTQNILSESVAVQVAAATTLGRSQGCSCPGGCPPAGCPCVSRGKRPWYTTDGRLVQGAGGSSTEMGLAFECSMLCACGSSCPNRVVQRGTRVQLQLFRVPAKGWGVRTVQDVPQGAFLCQYFGELISSTEAGRRLEDTYFFVVDPLDGHECCLDGRFYGNVGRFLNHSCQPNLVAVQVVLGPGVPSIAFFSTRPIHAGEELGFDYGERFWAVKGEGCRCLCGAPSCRYQAPRRAGPCPAAAAAGDLASGRNGGAARHPLRGFALKSKRRTPLKVVTRSQRAREEPLPGPDP
ncbi:histone-lysine N-methyltransferase EHMT2-like isoform X2 [Paroedura picta]|uniref:histone-lysine N-methyltransferase EHMT2-like isoform X2 n=1 Tax=Paroedura picta TaxID=143630 RepID=UPI0040561BE1